MHKIRAFARKLQNDDDEDENHDEKDDEAVEQRSIDEAATHEVRANTKWKECGM